MGSFKGQRLQADILKALTIIFQREFLNSRYIKTLTIHEVRLTSDKRIAKIFYSTYDVNAKLENVEAEINKHLKYIKKMLAQKISARIMPEIIFVYDTALDNANRIEKLLKGDQ
ncbi:30S ribosome-binding factor RbfA [Spiroplasma endosymbiont of Crioceris asparagi]|uniref:30S ribosome-binding factor RbfA n=1 Tax=Spiroplasma endosymbiont of Crioceris asparagi TaxID=3066286 RepID=UPI0030CF4138